MVKIGIAGGSGYSGGELIRNLAKHPRAQLCWISSRQFTGQPVASLYPNLRGFVDCRFDSLDSLPDTDLDVLFLALPHGHAMRILPRLPRDLVVIDLSGDFRISDAAVFEQHYGFPQEAPQHQSTFVYGLPEILRDRIRRSSRVANPGCFATATILALHPLYQEGWVKGPVFVDTKTGSSGAGRGPGAKTHHPRRSNSFFPYKPFRHQHVAEISQILDTAAHPLVFQTYSTPLVRGIFASHYMELDRPLRDDEARDLYSSYYGDEFFIRWAGKDPDINFVRNGNFVDLGAAHDDQFLIVWSTLDNLQKGAAGQAIQNMNLICGLPETMGLDFPPSHP